jgi:FixJ family two-component response regulator
VTDVIMAPKDGAELILELRRRDANARIVAISGKGPVGPYFSRLAGADEGLTKPVDRDDLVSAVEGLLKVQ